MASPTEPERKGAAANVVPAEGGPASAPPQERDARPLPATAGIFLMAGAGFAGLGLGVYFLFLGGNPFGGLLFLVLGAAYASGARALYRGESWGWGAGVFAGALFVLFGLFLMPLSLLALGPAIAVVLILAVYRESYGVLKYDPEEERRRKEELKALRMANPEGLHCPHCGSTALWIAPDGSAYCDACKRGIISIRPAS